MKVERYATATKLNTFLSSKKWGAEQFIDTIFMRPLDLSNYNLRTAIELGNELEKGLTPELNSNFEDNIGVFQVYGEKLVDDIFYYGFADILGYDNKIYDIKYKKKYEGNSFVESMQHIVYSHIFDRELFEYLIWTDLDDKKLERITPSDIFDPMFKETYLIGDCQKNELRATAEEMFEFIEENELYTKMYNISCTPFLFPKHPKEVGEEHALRLVGANILDVTEGIYWEVYRGIKQNLLEVDNEGYIKKRQIQAK